jgi:hypothetical protein
MSYLLVKEPVWPEKLGPVPVGLVHVDRVGVGNHHGSLPHRVSTCTGQTAPSTLAFSNKSQLSFEK